MGLLRGKKESPGNSKPKGKKKESAREGGFLPGHSAFVRQISHR